MQHRSISRFSYAIAALGLLVLGACGPQSNSPFDSPQDQNLALQAQHEANLRALEEARAKSNAVYEQMLAAWNARNSGNRPMTTAGNSPFVPCAPLPFNGEAQIIGPNGGTFTFGPHTLMVPPGALNGLTSIAVMVNTDVKTKVTLLPHGTQFAVPVRLTLAYAHCEESNSHRVAFIDALSNILEWTNSTDRPADSRIDAWLNHFSDYAIAY